MKHIKKKLLGMLLTVMLAVSAFSGTTVFAEAISIDDESYTSVSSISELETALEEGETCIYLKSGTYEIPSDFITIPAGTVLLGASADTVIFETATNNTSGQAGLYITESGVTLKNITIQNSSSASYPPLKIEASNVTLMNCVITNNAKKSALVIHGSSDVLIENCIVANTNTAGWYSKNIYAAIQVNGGSSVTISGGTVTTSINEQPNIAFEYSSSSDAYLLNNTLYIDSSVSFTGGYKNVATIYSAVPSSVDRVDTVYVDGVELQRQTDTSDDSGLATDGTGWYCYNVEAWSSSLLNTYNGYVYTNSSDSSVLNHIKIGLALWG